MEKPYKIGTVVEIINKGKYYPGNVAAAEELGATKWQDRAEPKNGETGKITGISKVFSRVSLRAGATSTDYLVDIGRCEIVIGRAGIRKVLEWDE